MTFENQSIYIMNIPENGKDKKVIIVDNRNSTLAIVLGFAITGMLYFRYKLKKARYVEKLKEAGIPLD